MDEGLFQLIFLALVFVGWLIRAAAEARRRRETRTAPPPPREGRPTPAPTLPLPPPPPATASTSVARHADRFAYGGLKGLESTAWAGTSETNDTTAQADHQARHEAALRRLLGGLDVRPGKEVVRAGILWSEVLGPCRALRGPHRPPTYARRPR